MPLKIDCLPLGDLQTNCYIIHLEETATAWIVDPPFGIQPLLKRLELLNLRVDRIVITHGHADHIAGIAAVKKAFPQAVITAPAADAGMLTDAWLNLSAPFGASMTAPAAEELVRPGQQLQFGNYVWDVLDTAGHTPGGVSYYCQSEKLVIVGDALFAGSVGRCDLPGSDFDLLIANIRTNLLPLPPETIVLPGHGPSTTIGREKQHNEFLAR